MNWGLSASHSSPMVRSELAEQSPVAGKIVAGGKSGLHRAECQVTPGRREPTESAAESRPPYLLDTVRVKRCGKSAPREW